MKKILLLVFLYTILPGYSDTDVELGENILAFANHLRETGDLETSYGEFFRALFFTEDSVSRAVIKRTLGDISYGMGNYALASKWYKEAYSETSDQLFLHDRAVLSGYRIGLYEMETSERLLSVRYFLQSDFSKAAIYQDDLPENLNHVLGDLIRRGESRKDKSPALAAILSAFLPGAGRIYSNQFLNGLFSSLSVGITGYFAYELYQDGGVHNPFFWLIGGTSLVFYSGTVYGSYQDAHRGNQIFRQGLYDDFWARVDEEYWP